MKNYIYKIKRQCDEDCDFFCHYCDDDENSVSVWADTYPFKIDFKFIKRKINEVQSQKLRDKFGIKKHMSEQPEYKKTSHGKLNFVFNTAPQLKNNKIYKMSVDFVEIDWRYRLKTAKFKIVNDLNDVIESGEISVEKLFYPQSINIFLVRLVNLFYQKLIKLGISLENQLTSSYWLGDKFELEQSVYLKPQKENWKFNFKIKQVDDEYTYDDLITHCNGGESWCRVSTGKGEDEWCDPFKRDVKFNNLLKIVQDVNQRIEIFARKEIQKHLENVEEYKDLIGYDEDELFGCYECDTDSYFCEPENHIEYTVDDFEIQPADDMFRFKVQRDYRVSDYDKPLTVCAEVKLVDGELQLEENEESDFWVKDSVKSEKSRVVLDDFDKKSQQAIEHWCAANWKEEIENHDNDSGGTLNWFLWYYKNEDLDEEDENYISSGMYDENKDYE